VSIDGSEAVHDRLRGVPGTYERSVVALREAQEAGLRAQINTVVMRSTVEDLPHLAALMVREHILIWEVFFLVATGRAMAEEYLLPQELRDVTRFLLEVTRYGLEVRTVEAPFIRRTLMEDEAGALETGALYDTLLAAFVSEVAGSGSAAPGTMHMRRTGTLDGDGIVFVAQNGDIYPGGLAPLVLGNVRQDSLRDVYRTNETLRAIRARSLSGACGLCPYRFACGGSRARALAATGDVLGTDPLCPWLDEPKSRPTR
jgi:radical SAM protein with 4Fe4S-binding SPASM domain